MKKLLLFATFFWVNIALADTHIDIEDLKAQDNQIELSKTFNLINQKAHQDAKECEIAVKKTQNDMAEYTVNYKTNYNTSKIIFLTVNGAYDCGGAHPDSYTYGVAYDTKTGKRIKENELYNIGERKGEYVYLTNIIAQKIYTKFSKYNEKECLDSYPDYKSLMNDAFTYSLLKNGDIQIYLDHTHAVEPCFDNKIFLLHAKDAQAYQTDMARSYGIEKY